MSSQAPGTNEVPSTEAEPTAAVTAKGRRQPFSSAGRFFARPVVLPVIALVLAVTLGALVVANHRRSAEEAARVDAPKVVAEHVTKLLSYTPATVSTDLATKKKWLTGDFLDEYTVLVTKTIAPAAVSGGVTADASVVARGVQTATSDRVEMLMFVNVVTTRTGAETPQSQGSRVRVVALKIDGSWLISSLTPV